MPPKFGNPRPTGRPAPPMPRQQQQQQQQAPSGGRHTILLIQQTPESASRTYTDHESVNDAMRALIGVFEAGQLAKQGPGRSVSYTTDQLLGFIDAIHDVSMLCFDKTVKAYTPHDRKFIKDKIYLTLSKQAGAR